MVCDRALEEVLAKDFLNIQDLEILLSDVSSHQLEGMARRANEESLLNFGRTVSLFTPLYLGNHCENQCIYCAFNQTYKVKRKTMAQDEIHKSCQQISESGLDEVLLLTGESRKHTGLAYIKKAVDIASNYFNGVGIEVYPLEKVEYEALISVGCSSLTIYQETYNRERYDELHLSGPKKDYDYRFGAPSRAAQAGMNKIQIGALLGLSDPIEDAIETANHLSNLMKAYPEVEWGLSLPRLKDIENGDFIGEAVDDRLYVQILLAFRLLFPKVVISVSTRESLSMRRNLLALGINKLSAGVSTAVGGSDDTDTKQFEISDTSSVDEVKKMLKSEGYQAIFRNWVML